MIRITLTPKKGFRSERYFTNTFFALAYAWAFSFLPLESMDIEFLTKNQLRREIAHAEI